MNKIWELVIESPNLLRENEQPILINEQCSIKTNAEICAGKLNGRKKQQCEVHLNI